MPAAGPAVSLRCQAQVPAPCRDNKSQQMLADQGWFGPQGDVSLSMEQVRRARAGGQGPSAVETILENVLPTQEEPQALAGQQSRGLASASYSLHSTVLDEGSVLGRDQKYPSWEGV